jgi:putative aldouronate transport system permease protein
VQRRITMARSYKRIRLSWRLYVCLLPALLYITLFSYLPMYGVQIAFRNYSASLGIMGSPWVGLKHFRQFVNSIQFGILVGNTLKISLYSLLVGFPIPILLALMLNEVKSEPFKKFVQNATYIPHFISTVVMCSMIIMFTSTTNGIINNLISRLGGNVIDFMGKSQYFRSIYVISDVWQHMGWNSIIYLAALSAIDPQLYEAAEMDGAIRIQKIWHITLPSIMPTIVLLLILRCGNLLSVGYEKIYLLQNSLNIDVSEVISTYVYKVGILSARFSYTSAIGLFNSIINFALLLIVNSLAKHVSGAGLF